MSFYLFNDYWLIDCCTAPQCTAEDAVYCQTCSMVGLLVTNMSSKKRLNWEMPFRSGIKWTKKPCFGWGPRSHHGKRHFWGNTLACPDLSADVLNLIRKVAAFGYQYCSNLFNVISDSFLDTVQRDLGTWTPCWGLHCCNKHDSHHHVPVYQLHVAWSHNGWNIGQLYFFIKLKF